MNGTSFPGSFWFAESVLFSSTPIDVFTGPDKAELFTTSRSLLT